jgi:hypothetical protein
LLRTQLQARMQLEARRDGRPRWERLPIDSSVTPPRGLLRLPAPSPGDMFLDFEGDRLGVAGGREFLFGLAWFDATGTLIYRGRWAHSDAEERAAFEELIDTIIQRLAQWPDAHVYHYAPYEPAAIGRMMGRYATREDEVDGLLRGQRLVDLCAITRQAVRASVEQYSLKDLELLFGFVRTGDLRTAGACVRAVQLAIGTGAGDHIDPPTRAAVEAYNRDDCAATAALRTWLEAVRAEAIAAGCDVPRPVPATGEASEGLTEARRRVARVTQALLVDLPEDAAGRSAEQQARWLLAQLVDYHRREDKVAWWNEFRLRGLEPDDALDERGAIAGLELVERVEPPKRGCPTDRYRYPTQELGVRLDDELKMQDGQKLGGVVAIDREAKTIDIKKTKKTAEVHPQVLYANKLVSPVALRDSLLALAEHITALGAGGRFMSERDIATALALLHARPPMVVLARRDDEDSVQHCSRLAMALQGEVLAIQGPPGAGKTHTAAAMITTLIKAGKRVGVTGPSHKVIRNLLAAVAKDAAKQGLPLRAHQKVDHVGRLGELPRGLQESKDDALAQLASGEIPLVGATAWMWASRDAVASVDVLFIDEAGQVPLANALAVAPAGAAMVLLGDPQQLDRPQRGSHPDGAEVSCLQHLIGERATIAADRGVLLPETWRMHPAITEFTSVQFYEGRLASRPGLEQQTLAGASPLPGAGLWLLPVPHDGNATTSDEEAAAIVALARRLLESASTWTDRNGECRRLTPEDILVVAPYNAHVDLIRERLHAVTPAPWRVGTVDKFQGQEAPIVIYAMGTSSPDLAPRGLEFLYSASRLNVATSRAKAAVVVVASPRLFAPECHTPRQMQLASGLCRYVEMARVCRP